MWLPSGSVLGGRPDGRLLVHGPSLVRRRHRHLHRPHRLAEDGERVERSRRAASVPRGQVGPQWNKNSESCNLMFNLPAATGNIIQPHSVL